MSFFQRADTLVSENGLFHGTTEFNLLVLVHACGQQGNLRRDEEGNPTSLAMSRRAEQKFCAHYGVSADQYLALVDLCDAGGGVGDVHEAYLRSLPENVHGVAPDFVERSVMYGGTYCSNESCDQVAMRVSVIRSTFYGLGECYPIEHHIKTCRGGCGAAHHVNKKRQRGPDGVTWHTFYPWDEGIPLELANKSGRSILSVPLLTHVAVTLSRMRVGFTAIAEVYNQTVVRDSGNGSADLAVDTILECWSLFAALKIAQGVWPWVWFPPEGSSLVVSEPQAVVIADVEQLQGANHWAGLRVLMSEQLEGFWARAPWHRHSCDLCRKWIFISGQWRSLKAAVIDGITNTRGPCCAVHECPYDLLNLGGARYCAHHAPLYAHRCAVTLPACPNNHMPGSLACAEHQAMERRWTYFNRSGDYRRKQRMKAAGEKYEPEDLRLLRLMFSRHMSYGHLVGSMNCGIIAGIADLPSHEGMGIVCEGLDLIWPDPICRPNLLFYDNGCKLLTHRLLFPNLLWLMTRYIVDRFHFRTHTEVNCAIFCSPEARDDPALWHITPNGDELFLWNSSRAESNNAWLEGFGHVVKQMPRVLRVFFLNHAILVRNELTLNAKLMSENPNFDG